MAECGQQFRERTVRDHWRQQFLRLRAAIQLRRREADQNRVAAARQQRFKRAQMCGSAIGGKLFQRRHRLRSALRFETRQPQVQMRRRRFRPQLQRALIRRYGFIEFLAFRQRLCVIPTVRDSLLVERLGEQR